MRVVFIKNSLLLRTLNNTTLKDHVSTNELLKKFNILSVNQLAASIKLAEAWKAIKTTDYPIELDKHNANRPATNRVLRESSTRVWREDAATKIGKESFCRNAAKLWNNVSSEVKEAETIYKAKIAIKKYCLTLPI